jgi:hypothetical protein
MFKNPLLTRANISSYYIALLFGVLFFQQEWFRNIINVARDYIRQVLSAVNKSAPFSEWTGYWILIASCFVVVFLLRLIVVKPSNLFMNNETARDNFESLPFLILLIGAFLYYINTYFGDIMPKDIPAVIRTALGGDSDKSFPNFVWNTAPIAMFFLINRHSKKAANEAAAKAAEAHH